MGSTTKAKAGIIALIAVCIVSLVAVSQLAKSSTQSANPTIGANQNYQAPVTTVPPVAPTSQPLTPDTTQPAPSETQTTGTDVESSENVLTTYNLSTTMVEIPTTIVNPTTIPATTVTAPTTVNTTVEPPYTSATTTRKPATTDPNIQQAANADRGFLDYKYNETGNYYYTDADPWQRAFGFNHAYDVGSQFVFMFYDSARIKFSYGNKDWMVETWKGQYGFVFLGAEIGVYYKPKDRDVEHYDCVSDDDALYMEMTLYRNGEELLSREYTKYWWCTGFVPGRLKKYSDRSELNLKMRITMPNKTMLKAFVGGLNNCEDFKFIEGVNYRVDGRDVFINW